MKEILKYELSAFPLSLSTYDGSLTKTVKSKLFQVIQDQIKVLSTSMRNTPSIFDDMMLLQKIPSTLETFGALSDYLLNRALRGSCRVAYFITDQYLENSIKLMERNRRKTNECVDGCQEARPTFAETVQEIPWTFRKQSWPGEFPTQRLVNSNISAP